jgi:hypothetical protein
MIEKIDPRLGTYFSNPIPKEAEQALTRFEKAFVDRGLRFTRPLWDTDKSRIVIILPANRFNPASSFNDFDCPADTLRLEQEADLQTRGAAVENIFRALGNGSPQEYEKRKTLVSVYYNLRFMGYDFRVSLPSY